MTRSCTFAARVCVAALIGVAGFATPAPAQQNITIEYGPATTFETTMTRATLRLRRVLETNKQTLARLEREKAVKESKLQQLLDEYDLARASYATLRKKSQDASLNVGARSTDLKMITPAVIPERPFKPRR